MCRSLALLLVPVACALSIGCGGGGDGAHGGQTDAGSTSTAPADSSGDDETSSTGGGSSSTGSAVDDPMPLLDPGPHLGMIIGFEEAAPGTETQVQGHWDGALSAGMDIGRIQVDWAELEPAPGTYDLVDFTSMLEALAADDVQIMVTLSTIDSLEYTVPADLSDPEDPLALAGGVAFDDPLVTDRFAGLLDQVIPLVKRHGGFLITVGNEPDNGFEDRPGFAAEVAGFTAAARAHAATVDPDVTISMTLTYASIDTYDVSQQIFDEIDVVTLNMYCQGDDGNVQDPAMLGPRLAAALDAVGDKPLVFQELGCPAGWEDVPTAIDGNLEKQRGFFEAFAVQMQAQPRLRAAYVFQMLDWSPALRDIFAQALIDAGFDQATIDLFTESLGTIGLCRWDDATCRPAWDEVLAAIAMLSA